VERDDPALPTGTHRVARGGMPGLRVLLIRRIRDPRDGRAHDDERAIRYAPRTQIVRVGTGRRVHTRVTPADTRPPEPLFDEAVSYRLRRGHDLPEVVARRAGRTGTRGWTLGETSEAPAP
jgi:hypothetical protein